METKIPPQVLFKLVDRQNHDTELIKKICNNVFDLVNIIL